LTADSVMRGPVGRPKEGTEPTAPRLHQNHALQDATPAARLQLQSLQL